MTNRNPKHLPPTKELLSGYLDYLRKHRGLGASSHRQQRIALSEFLAYIAGRKISLSEVTIVDLDGFVQFVSGLGLSSQHLCIRCYSLRGFLSYLFAEGWLSEDISSSVESPRLYRDATVPPHFTWAEIERLVASVEGDTPAALQDRAMLVLLCVYGLRSSEVARLTLDNLDWKHEVLHIEGRKGGSVMTLPLVPVVSAVLSQYLTKGRPKDAPHRELLLNNSGRPFRRGVDVTSRLHILVARAGLKGGRGAHAIRRAVGTRLVEQGLGAGAVAIILGHESLDSVRTYLRLSIESLRDVADNYGDTL